MGRGFFLHRVRGPQQLISQRPSKDCSSDEKPILTCGNLDRPRTLFVIVRHIVDPVANGIAPHQPMLHRASTIRRPQPSYAFRDRAIDRNGQDQGSRASGHARLRSLRLGSWSESCRSLPSSRLRPSSHPTVRRTRIGVCCSLQNSTAVLLFPSFAIHKTRLPGSGTCGV